MKQAFLVALLAANLIPALSAADQPAAPPQPTVKVGDVAPNFTLQDQNGNNVSLEQFKGKKIIALAFYVFAFTGG